MGVGCARMPLRQVKIRSEALRCTLNSALLCRRSAQQGFYFAEKRQDMGIGYYFRNGKTGFQTSGGCHLTKACWDEAWLLDDTDRALVRDFEVVSAAGVSVMPSSARTCGARSVSVASSK